MRRLEVGPIIVAVTIPVLLALFGSALVGGSGIDWFTGLVKPWFLVPLWVFYLVGLAYYVGGATVLYRVLAYVDDRGDSVLCLALTVGVMTLNELWNYLFFGLRSTLGGFLGIIVFLMPLTALLIALRRREVFSARLVAAYYLWVLYDLLWTYQMWRLNGA